MKEKKWEIDPVSLFSHELKTPLSSLRIGLSLLEKDLSNPKNLQKHKELFQLMQEEVERMIDFIKDNLDLRFIQNKKDLLQWEWINFKTLIPQVCSSLKLIAQAYNIGFDIKEKSKEDFEVFADPVWIKHVLENLLVNAICFSPNNGKVSIEYGLTEKNSFFCFIRDEGPGLPKNQNVFDLFYKRSSPFKRDLKNTGLGLNIAKEILLAHGGHISAFSEKEKPGAVFHFELPKTRLFKQAV